MNKTELMENYTSEQLADKYLRLQEEFNRYVEVIKGIVSELPEELENGTEFHLEISRLQSEVEKYRKAFEDEKKKRDYQVAEYRKKIKELKVENAELHCEMQAMKVFPDEIPEEPIKAAEMLITAKGECEPLHIGNDAFKDTYRIFGISELRQIAEHLLVYCNHNGEVEE